MDIGPLRRSIIQDLMAPFENQQEDPAENPSELPREIHKKRKAKEKNLEPKLEPCLRQRDEEEEPPLLPRGAPKQSAGAIQKSKPHPRQGDED